MDPQLIHEGVVLASLSLELGVQHRSEPPLVFPSPLVPLGSIELVVREHFVLSHGLLMKQHGHTLVKVHGNSETCCT